MAQISGIKEMETILGKRKDILALKPEELSKLFKVMEGMVAAYNDCCTGG